MEAINTNTKNGKRIKLKFNSRTKRLSIFSYSKVNENNFRVISNTPEQSILAVGGYLIRKIAGTWTSIGKCHIIGFCRKDL